MDPRFDKIFTSAENDIFQVVFFPDRIYHAQYLNATRSDRYRYNVIEVRNKLDLMVLKGEVYLDGTFLTNFVRIEYRSGRLVEVVREKSRLIGDSLLMDLTINPEDPFGSITARLRLHYCPWIRAFQVEVWGTLEPPATMSHDIKVRSMMGSGGDITRIQALTPFLNDVRTIKTVAMKVREGDTDEPLGYRISDPETAWDNNFGRTVQVPRTQTPSNPGNTVSRLDYEIDFRRGWYLDARATEPVRYVNGMVDYLDPNNPDRSDTNIIEMRWLLQQELGGTLVYFHEVTIPAGCIEGTHRHIGSEELYYIFEGTGIAHMGEGDDPNVSAPDSTIPTRMVDVYGIGKLLVREVPVQPGKIIYTKSGGIHGIRNTGSVPLRFVAFGYHTA